MKQYDVIVIGSGGGLKVALPAAQMGMKTALIEQEDVGGTCLNRGCIPSKMLIYPTSLPRRVREAHRINVTSECNLQVHYEELIKRISSTVDGMSARQRADLMRLPNMDLYPVHGRFVADRVIRAGTEELTASKVFIATGSRPQIPAIDGLGDTPFMTSREALRCTTLPKRLLVIGAGYIAVELGGAYAAAGAEVDFIVRSRFLRQEDRDIADSFSEIFGRSHAVHLRVTPLHVDYASNSFSVICQDPTGRKIELFGDALLVATGVRPCTDDLGLENTNIRINEDGYINVNDRMQTGAEGVYAIGDCVGHYLYRHTVNYEGEYLVRTAIEGADIGPIDYGPVPHAVFSEPEIASVGMTEQRALEQRKDFVVGKALYSDSNAGMARGYKYGFVKIVVDRATRQILGAHILGDEASNMIHLFIALMKMHGTLDDLLGMIWIHPALPETARDAARDARKRLDDQSP